MTGDLHLAFYKGWESPLGWAIRRRTGSPYSHVELVLDGGLGQASTCFSATYRHGVRVKTITLRPEDWDLVAVPRNAVIDGHLAAMKREATKPYDVLGVLTFGSPWLSLHGKQRWFCSELCAAALGLPNPWSYSPGALHKALAGQGASLRTGVTFLLPHGLAVALIEAAQAAGRLTGPATITQDGAVLVSADAIEALFEGWRDEVLASAQTRLAHATTEAFTQMKRPSKPLLNPCKGVNTPPE